MGSIWLCGKAKVDLFTALCYTFAKKQPLLPRGAAQSTFTIILSE